MKGLLARCSALLLLGLAPAVRAEFDECRFMDQAETDGNEKKNPHRLPLVFMREDGGEWLVMLKAEQMMAVALQLIHAADKSCGQLRDASSHHDEGSQQTHTD